MFTFHDEHAEINVDVDATRAMYERIESGGDQGRCACEPCQYFAAHLSEAFPADFLSLLERLGIDKTKGNETWWLDDLAPGWRYYHGSFDFVGTVCQQTVPQGRSPIPLT